MYLADVNVFHVLLVRASEPVGCLALMLSGTLGFLGGKSSDKLIVGIGPPADVLSRSISEVDVSVRNLAGAFALSILGGIAPPAPYYLLTTT